MTRSAEISPWRSPVGAPVPRSGGLLNRFWQRSLREHTIPTPAVEFTVAPRGFQGGQGQHPFGATRRFWVMVSWWDVFQAVADGTSIVPS